jgi:hypothetical protein
LVYYFEEMAERKTNPVWQHFTEPTPGKARCNICNLFVSMGAGNARTKNTSNMWIHLKRHHVETYNEAHKERDDRASASTASSSTQPTIVQMFDAQKKWGNSDTRSKQADLAIVQMIATDNQPFTVVSGVGFKRLVTLLEPRYSLKTEKFYRTDLFHDVHTKVENKIKELVTLENAGPHLSFTTDCWSGDTESLMSLTCHFINSDWERKQIVLNVKAMYGSHTGEYISEVFLSLLRHWGIDTERVLLVLRDSGANMVKGMRLTEVPDLSCSAHTLQLVVNDGINSQRAVKDIVAKLKSSATHFNNSRLAKQRLKAIQKDLDLPEHRIIQSVPTHWNSTLMESMLEQKRALTVYAGEHGKIETLTADQWTLVGNLIDTLSPLEQITREMSKSDSSISCIIPSIAVLKMLLEVEGAKTRGIKTLRNTMLDSLKARFENADKTKCLVLATLIDPRYRGHALAPEALSKAKAWITEEHAALSEAEKRKRASSDDQGPDPKRIRVEEEVEEDASPSDMLEKMYANLLRAHGPTTHQLNQYLREPLIDRQTGQPLDWWKQNPSRFQLLAHSPEDFSVRRPPLFPVRGYSARSARYMRKRETG